MQKEAVKTSDGFEISKAENGKTEIVLSNRIGTVSMRDITTQDPNTHPCRVLMIDYVVESDMIKGLSDKYIYPGAEVTLIENEGDDIENIIVERVMWGALIAGLKDGYTLVQFRLA